METIQTLSKYAINMFAKYQHTATVERLTTTTDWYKRQSFVSTGVTIRWHLKPLSITDSYQLSTAFWKDYKFTTNQSNDILESDRLTINWEKYDVKWVSPCTGITFKTKQVLLTKI